MIPILHQLEGNHEVLMQMPNGVLGAGQALFEYERDAYLLPSVAFVGIGWDVPFFIYTGAMFMTDANV
ncbi:hypothetical protein D5045_18850 [Verminephrobacter eiseniae]|nr:hypothetical protein [Verminephrobacter eiseniae]